MKKNVNIKTHVTKLYQKSIYTFVLFQAKSDAAADKHTVKSKARHLSSIIKISSDHLQQAKNFNRAIKTAQGK